MQQPYSEPQIYYLDNQKTLDTCDNHLHILIDYDICVSFLTCLATERNIILLKNFRVKTNNVHTCTDEGNIQ